MSSIDQLIENARALLESSQAENAIELLAPEYSSNGSDVEYLQIFGEVLLENNDVETAYEVLSKACKLDTEASKGTEKFFYLGQIIGGSEGLTLLDIGLNKLNSQLNLIKEDKGENDEILIKLSKTHASKNSLIRYLIKKLNQGIFAKIEIWMTDLCTELEAESMCDELIDFSLSLDSSNPEALSLLSSIRISQQRNEDAKIALLKSWELFSAKKIMLEESANNIQQGNVDGEMDSLEVSLEYVELVQPLLSLARFAIELELYDVSISIASNIQDINENILEPYYYESLSNLFIARKIFDETSDSKFEDYREIELYLLQKSANPEIQNLIKEAKIALTQGYKIVHSNSVDSDQDLIDQVSELVNELGGPIMSELLPSKRNDVEEEGWEDEIDSETEI